jgi:hypothetical protein
VTVLRGGGEEGAVTASFVVVVTESFAAWRRAAAVDRDVAAVRAQLMRRHAALADVKVTL